MIPAWSLAGVRRDLAVRFARDGFEEDAIKMVGLLLARPDSLLGRTEIVPNLPYFHHRAGKHIHFFCAGYGAYWPPGEVQDAACVVTIDQTGWLFSNRLFNDFRGELERATRWRYSGGTDLILTNALWHAAEGTADLDFTSSLAMNLDHAITDGAIQDASRWFERIFRFAESNTSNDPTWGFGVGEGLVAARSGLVAAILSLLPGSIGTQARRLPYFLATDLAV